jgi:orotidine-5'-phosphate decarboxylase
MTSTSSSIDASVRERLALALDVNDLDRALALARELAPWFGVAKVGLELYSAAGPEAILRLRDAGLTVFADLKLHDIPNTVGRAARVVGGLGASYLNFHAVGGVDMLRAGLDGLAEGATAAGLPAPIGLGVTVLTSDRDASAFATRLDAAITAGCGGVVCSMHEVPAVKRARPDFVAVVPGVRLADDDRNDQRRVGTPEAAAAAGADILVLGRSVTDADDRVRAAQAVAHAVQHAISRTDRD